MWVGPNNLLLCSSLVVCGYCSPGLRLVALICRIRHRRPIAKLHQHHQKPPSLPAPGRGSSPNYHCCSPARDTRVAIDVQIPCSQIYLPDLFAQTLAIALMEVMTKKTSFCYFRVYPQLSVALYSDNPCLVLNVPPRIPLSCQVFNIYHKRRPKNRRKRFLRIINIGVRLRIVLRIN